MEKVKYIISRIFEMNYKKMFDVINKIHKDTNRNRLFLLFDIIYCGFRYQAGYMDYILYEMFNMNAFERSTVLTRGKNNQLIKEYNNKFYWYIFDNKEVFNKRFDKYLGRSWFYIDNNYEEFIEFISDKKEIIIKPNNACCGVGVEKIKITSKTDFKSLYSKCVENNALLIEEVAKQHKELKQLHPNSVNTIRMVTLRNKYNVTSIVVALIRIGTNHNVVDNFNNGGICAPLDIEKGEIYAPAVDKDGNVFYKHPTTNVEIIGYKIPYWNEIKKLVLDASEVVPKVGLVGWDVCVSPSGPVLIEANQFPGHDLYQLPAHRKDKIGILPIFEDAINKKN